MLKAENLSVLVIVQGTRVSAGTQNGRVPGLKIRTAVFLIHLCVLLYTVDTVH